MVRVIINAKNSEDILCFMSIFHKTLTLYFVLTLKPTLKWWWSLTARSVYMGLNKTWHSWFD